MLKIEEALQEAITQLTNQGVDLSTLDTTGGIGRDDVIQAVEVIKQSAGKAEEYQNKDLVDALSNIKLMTTSSNVLSKRNINIVFKHGGWASILTLISIDRSASILIATLKFLIEICKVDG
jgi:hypothetical protein